MAKNLVTKIVEDHMVEGSLEPGEEVGIRMDQALLQDATGTMACLQLERMGLDRVQVDLAVQYVDHNVIQLDFKNPDDHRFLQAFAAKYGITSPARETASATTCTWSASPDRARRSSGRIHIRPPQEPSGP
jgi:homoaconitase/3-isopropylmalate dehydratase large subunit